LSDEASLTHLPARRGLNVEALFCGRQFPLGALGGDVLEGYAIWPAQPNRPLSRGTRVVPMRATPPPAMSWLIP